MPNCRIRKAVLQPQLLDESAGEPEVRQLIPRMKRLPIRRSVSIPDFEGDSLQLTTRYSASGPLPPGIVENKIASYQVTGVKDTLNSYNVTSGKLAVVFHMGVDGILEIERADIAVSWNGTVVEKVLDVDPPATPEEKDEPDTAEGEAAAEEGASGGENATSAEDGKENAEPKEKPANTPKFKEVEMVKPMTAKPRLNHTVVWEHVPSLNKTDVFKMTDSLLELMREDRAKKENVEEAEDWLYEGGEGGGANANKTQFTAKKGELMDQFRAVGYRADELKKRPGVVEEARTFLAETTELLELWTTTKPWLPESGKAGLLDSIKTFNVTLEKWVAEQEETSLACPSSAAP